MLQSNPTKRGTGVAIYGDYGDLISLYDTVHYIANTLNEATPMHQLLMNFAYEIRHAYQGDRDEDVHSYGDGHKVHYYGFNIVWTDIIIFIATLRHCAGYILTQKLNQANLYILEYVVEKALFEYDPEGAHVITENYIQRTNVLNPYVFLIYQAMHIQFVSGVPGKNRFRNIPNLFRNHLSEYSPEYKNFISSLELSAKQNNCDIKDLEFNDFPDIKW